MSYCRFEGTRNELLACLNEAECCVDGEPGYSVSEKETNQFRRMVTMFVDWMHDMCLLDCNGELDMNVLNEICEAMVKGNEE